jgi:hypothetical protein
MEKARIIAMKFYYPFVDIRGGGEEDGILYTCEISQAEIEAKVDLLTDPELAMKTEPGEAAEPWDAKFHDRPEIIAWFEDGIMAGRLKMPPLYELPQGSRLYQEWFRRAEILKAERARKHALEAQGQVFGDD